MASAGEEVGRSKESGEGRRLGKSLGEEGKGQVHQTQVSNLELMEKPCCQQEQARWLGEEGSLEAAFPYSLEVCAPESA